MRKMGKYATEVVPSRADYGYCNTFLLIGLRRIDVCDVYVGYSII